MIRLIDLKWVLQRAANINDTTMNISTIDTTRVPGVSSFDTTFNRGDVVTMFFSTYCLSMVQEFMKMLYTKGFLIPLSYMMILYV